MQDFVHLHVHTQYSILDGQASIPRLVDKAIANGMRGIAVTDHGDMFGIKEFFNYVNKKNGGTNGEIKDLKKKIAALESGKAESAQVTVFPLNNGQEYIVESGLQEGEVIVAEGAGLIQENTQILSLHTEK